MDNCHSIRVLTDSIPTPHLTKALRSSAIWNGRKAIQIKDLSSLPSKIKTPLEEILYRILLRTLLRTNETFPGKISQSPLQ